MVKGFFIMEFNKWYDYYFRHNGFCPMCGKYMAMSVGCYKMGCRMAEKAAKKDDWIRRKILSIYHVKYRRKKRDEEFFRRVNLRKAQNLDTSQKKHYIEVDNQGISE